MARTTRYYAAYRPYGLDALNSNGPRADKLLTFPTRTERDAWVERDEDHREELRATANEVRAALRFEQRNGYRVIHTPDNY